MLDDRARVEMWIADQKLINSNPMGNSPYDDIYSWLGTAEMKEVIEDFYGVDLEEEYPDEEEDEDEDEEESDTDTERLLKVLDRMEPTEPCGQHCPPECPYCGEEEEEDSDED